MALKRIIRDQVPLHLVDKIPTSFDIIGSRGGAVAILEIPPELEDYKYAIAKAVVQLNKHVKAVLRKKGGRAGEFRLYQFEVLIEGPTEVIHREHGYSIKVDPTKVYFSPRDQTDRLEIAGQVKEGERVLYLFAGVGPYAVAIAKLAKPRLVVAVELNPWGFKYMVENFKINKIRNAVAVHGDVAEVAPLFKQKFDRVLLTLPLGAYKYFPTALECLEEGYVHFYHLGREDAPFKEAEEVVSSSCPNCQIVGRRIVRDYAPGVYKVRLDIYKPRKT
ncbi:MAG: class I SAM-dependent methyltransferase family protein [Pyrobaculum sp.]